MIFVLGEGELAWPKKRLRERHVHFVAIEPIHLVGVGRDNGNAATEEQIPYVKPSVCDADKLITLNHVVCGFALDLLVGA